MRAANGRQWQGHNYLGPMVEAVGPMVEAVGLRDRWKVYAVGDCFFEDAARNYSRWLDVSNPPLRIHGSGQRRGAAEETDEIAVRCPTSQTALRWDWDGVGAWAAFGWWVGDVAVGWTKTLLGWGWVR